MTKIKTLQKEILAQFWATFSRYTFQYLSADGIWHSQKRVVFDRGNGVGILLYNLEQNKVLLTRQFRLPAYLQQVPPDGLLIEVCAGKLDKENEDPAEGIKREVLEETGYKITEVKKVLEGYASPGAVTERLHLFVASYHAHQKIAAGGGLAEEQEEIETIEMPFDEAMDLVMRFKIIDCKTIMLLQYAAMHIFK